MDSINKTIATVATTLEQLESKDADDAQVGYEAVSATQDVNFTAAVGEGPLNPSPDDTCQITATWTYPQVKGQGVGVANFTRIWSSSLRTRSMRASRPRWMTRTAA